MVLRKVRRTDPIAEIVDFKRARDAALLDGNVDTFIVWATREAPHIPWGDPTKREAVEITMHQVRTSVLALPREKRKESWEWLKERGLETMDDGDLSNA